MDPVAATRVLVSWFPVVGGWGVGVGGVVGVVGGWVFGWVFVNWIVDASIAIIAPPAAGLV
jgi:hypothetical protein